MCAGEIFGINIGSLQGKTKHIKSSQIRTVTEDLPVDMLKQHGKVTFEVDIMYVHKFLFMITISRGTHFGTTELIKNEKASNTSIIQVIESYHRWGLKLNI